jgi:hypothetical protein
LTVSGEDDGRLLKHEVGDQFELQLSFFDIVSDGQEAGPVLSHLLVHRRILLDQRLLVLEYLADASNSVVPRVIELSRLGFLGVYFAAHLVLHSFLQSFQAEFRVQLEGGTAVLSDDTDSVTGSLSERRRLVVSEGGHSLDDDHVVFLAEVRSAQMFDHIVEDEEAELHAFLDAAGERLVESGGAELGHNVRDEWLVGLEQGTDKLSSS